MTKYAHPKQTRSIAKIAQDIINDWAGVAPNYSADRIYFGAHPYLSAMIYLDSISDHYYADSARSIIAYFLANAGTWKGETARRIKKELKDMLK